LAILWPILFLLPDFRRYGFPRSARVPPHRSRPPRLRPLAFRADRLDPPFVNHA